MLEGAVSSAAGTLIPAPGVAVPLAAASLLFIFPRCNFVLSLFLQLDNFAYLLVFVQVSFV